MNIMISANENYYLATKVMLKSLLSTNTFEKHTIYFLYADVSEEKVEGLRKLVEKNGAGVLVPRKMSKADFKDVLISHHMSIETYFRFFAQEVVPETEDRVLWLDVDMIVMASLKEHYYQDFEGNYLVVCRSINQNPQALLDKLGCPPGTVYFNAGMLLMNLKLMRETLRVQDFFAYLDENRERITWHDQDVLNGMFALKTKVADYRKYNMQMFSDTQFSQKEIADIKETAHILHYLGRIKPWHTEFENYFGKVWFAYARKALNAGEKRVLYVQHGKVRLRKGFGRLYWRVRSFASRCYHFLFK